MKKNISILLILTMIFTSSLVVFAADQTEKSVPSDVVGTTYETAVKALIADEIISGYPDGSFQPDKTLTRAEACAMIVKAKKLPVTTAQSEFNDVNNTWSQPYVAAAAFSGIISGYPDGTFKPDRIVTIQELATMLLNAEGHKDLEGHWPSNYIAKAIQLGLDAETKVSDWSSPASRGLSAQMVYNMLKPGTDQTATSPAIDTGDSSKNQDSGNDQNSSSAAFEDGTIYAMIEGITRVKTADSGSKDAASVVFNKEKKDVILDGSSDSVKASDYLNGQLYEIRIRKGNAVKINKPSNTYFQELTASSATAGAFALVQDMDDSGVTINGKYLPISKKNVVYTVQFNKDGVGGYRTGSLSNITKGSLIRGYDASDDDNKVINVIVLIKRSDISNYL